MIPAGFYPASFFFSIAPDLFVFSCICFLFGFFSQLVFNILNFDSELCWFLFHVFLSVFLPAAELSLLLREMILKLFSEHLSADGKVMLSLMLTECMLLFCKSNSAFGSVPHSVYCCTGQAVCSYEVSLWQTEKTCLQTFLLYFSLQVFLWPIFKVVCQDILTG